MNLKLRFVRYCLLMLAVVFFMACNSDDSDSVEYTAEREAEILGNLLTSLAENGVEVDTTELGVYYIMEELGDGGYARTGDSVSVKYIGYFVNGSVFDSSLSNVDEVYNYRHISDPMIPGFEDAVNQLQKGGSGSFIMTSDLAYGPNGYYFIPPYTTLIFDIELVDIFND